METNCLNILIGEDDSFSQKVIVIVLKKLGISADIASNGVEVIQALERKTYAIILMDIQMPYMDGIEATRTIRERWSHGPKIIMITGCAPDIYRKLCFDAGANAFLSKPLRIKELINAIERYMPNTLKETQSV
jgi:CheY-like chemotaxis protein